MRLAMVVIGILLSLASFWSHATKKMTLDLAVAWCLAGITIVVIGAVPALSRWLEYISAWTGAALLMVAIVGLWSSFRICLVLSRLAAQNQELAMQVSLLLASQQQTAPPPAAAKAEEKTGHEKSTVCY